MEVVHSGTLTLAEKRAILASWASDACAVEAAPDLRAAPGGQPVKWDDIMDALHLLDGAARPSAPRAWRLWCRSREDAGNAPTPS